MVLGVGVDLVSMRRIERVYRRRPQRFLQRLFTGRERALLQKRPRPVPALAARFAAKEAVLKALGCGIGPAGLAEIEVLADRGRPPEVFLHGHAARIAAAKGVAAVAVSMTHDPPFAAAMAVITGK